MAAPGVAEVAARSPLAAAHAKQLHEDAPFRRRSTSVPSRCVVLPRKSASALPMTKAAGTDAASRIDPRGRQASSAAPASPPTNAATTCRPLLARRRGVSPPPDTNNQPRHQQPARADQQVRAERYGEAPSGSSFDCEPWQTHRLEGAPDDLLSRPQPVEARHLESAWCSVTTIAANCVRAVPATSPLNGTFRRARRCFRVPGISSKAASEDKRKFAGCFQRGMDTRNSIRLPHK